MNDNVKLPKILAVLACDDHGPCDPEPTATCPHCGADGRYVYTFLCEDGSTRGAMKGCIKLFPISPLAKECEKALSAQHCKGYVSKLDAQMIDAIERLRNKTIDLLGLEQVAKHIKLQKQAWMRRKGYIR